MKIIFIMMSFFLVLMIPSSTIIQNEPTYHLVLESTIEGPLAVGTFDLTYYYFIKSDQSGYEEIIPLTYHHFSRSDLDKVKFPGLHQLTITHEAQTFHLNVLMTAPVIPSLMEQIYQKGIEEDVIDMTYEEWLLSIKGETGRSIVDAHINEEGLLHLTFCDGEVLPLVNVIGPQGEDATIIEMNLIDDQIQWRYLNEEWNPLIAMDDLKGLRGLRGYTGATGATGETPEIRVFEGFLQSKAPSIENWVNILDLNTLKPDAARSINDASVNQNGDLIITYSDGSTHLAGSIPKTHTVILVGLDGKVLDFQTVSHGGDARTVIPPLVEGYQFNDWSRAMTNITQDTLIKADYTLNQVTLSFNVLGGLDVDPITIDYGSSVSLPTPTKEGFSFKGWFYGESIHDQQITQQTSILENITVFARWDVEIYNVIFAVDGSILQQSYTLYNQEVLPPETPIKAGFEFIGWNHTSSSVTSDLWIEALFEETYQLQTYSMHPDGLISGVSILINEEVRVIESGNAHSGFLTSNHRLIMWGHNLSGQLGDGSTLDKAEPFDLTPSINIDEDDFIVDIALGGSHTLVVTSLGRVFGWGRNNFGQLGLGNTTQQNTPTELSGQLNLAEGDQIIKVYAGRDQSMAISQAGKIFSWGRIHSTLNEVNANTGHTQNSPLDVSHLFNLDEGDEVMEALFTFSVNTILTKNHQLFTWGDNTFGQVGIGDHVTYHAPFNLTSEMNLESGEYPIRMKAGDFHVMILTNHHQVYRWGRNDLYQLGNGNVTSLHTPTLLTVSLDPGERIEGIAAGLKTSMLWTSLNRIFAFGDNSKNQYLNDTGDIYPTPGNITDSLNPDGWVIEHLNLGTDAMNPFHFIIYENVQVYAYGTNTRSQLGIGDRNATTELSKTLVFKPQLIQTYLFKCEDPLNIMDPVLPGYTFSGWYTDIELNTSFNETTMPEESLILYAKWALE